MYAGVASSLFGTVLQVLISRKLTVIFCKNFVYFYAYGIIRGGYVKRKGNQEISTLMELLLGALSGKIPYLFPFFYFVIGATTQFFTLPIAVITTRQQTLPPNEQTPFFHSISKIIDDDGYKGLWRGLQASLVLCINPAITYGLFERLKSILEKKRSLTSLDAFCIGAVSKTLATVVTCKK